MILLAKNLAAFLFLAVFTVVLFGFGLYLYDVTMH